MDFLIKLIIPFAFVFSAWAQTYKSAEIGNQVWMTENLDVTTFRNGDVIPGAQSGAEWEKFIADRKPAWCYYDMDSSNNLKIGKLYNWYAVIDSRGLAPEGWHVPSDCEWQKLIDFLGGDKSAGSVMKESGLSDWQAPNAGATNKSKFSVLPGGYRYHEGFFYKGYNAFFFSSTEHSTCTAWTRVFNYDNTEVYRYFGNKWDGYSVRCIKN